jgi:hypothetical protein
MTDDTKKPHDEPLDDAEPSAPSSGESEASETAAVEAPKPKKLKKGKKADGAKAEGAEKIEVIDDSPEGRQLKEAQVAFEIGDYKTTRALATKLAGHERAAIADGARDLLRRTNIDPAQMIFLAACLCALIGVAFYYLR